MTRLVIPRGATAIGLAILFSSAAAAADARVVAGGFAYEVDANAHAVHVKKCEGADCKATAKDVALTLEKGRADGARATAETVAVGDGKQVVHVRVPDVQRKDLAFEAIFHGDAVVWSGLTGYTKGSEGDRSGEVVLVYDRDAQSKFVMVGETREDTRICGQQTTLLSARGLDPKTMTLRGATMHRLDKKARDGAQRVIATARPTTARPPLARLLNATGGSAPNARAMTDGDVATAWSETRPGDGHGEFVTMRAPGELPIHALVVTVAPTKPKVEGAAPRTIYVATDGALHHVTLPEDGWAKPGQSYEIPLPAPVKTTCVAVVLDEAYARGKEAPEVSIAEVFALTKLDLDGATLDDAAKALSGPKGEEAAALLKRAGDEGLAAAVRAYEGLDGRGRALAVDVAASTGTCVGPTGDLLVQALVDKDVEVKRRALGRVERCGKAAGEMLAKAVRGEDEARRAACAPLLATVAPALGVDAFDAVMGKGGDGARRAVRSAFARAITSTPREKLLALLGAERTPQGKLDLVRALGPRLADLRPESDAAIADILKSNPDMATRYLVAEPLAKLARHPNATQGELTRLAELVRRDPEWPVRARATELSAGIAPLVPAIVAAAEDKEPRVREAAVRALATSPQPSATPVLGKALAKDEWTFVRVAAAESLGAMPESADASGALVKALADGSAKVRWSAMSALGKQRAVAHAGVVRERLDDAKEDADVRALAAKTLGAMCVQSASDRLTKLAVNARQPTNEADDRIGIAAIEALGALHPSDIDQRLAPLRSKEVRLPVRRAAERAIAEPGGCR